MRNFLFVFAIILTSDVFAYKIQNNINDISDDLSEDELYSQSGICNTTVCETAGKSLKSNLNASVDPCDDFYEFACGTNIATHTIPDDQPFYFGDNGLQDKIFETIKQELSQTKRKSDSNAVIFATNLYKACIDNATRESRGVQPLIDAINSIGGWPLIGKSSVYKDKDFDWKESYASMIANLAINPVFGIGVGPDANDTKVNRFGFSATGFGLGRNQLLSPSEYPDIVKAYKKFILQSALLLGAKNDSQTHKDIEDLFAFEQKLANETLAEEESRDSDVWYNKMSFKEFNELTDKRVDWLNLTNRIYSKLNSTIRVKSEELVIVSDIDYYKVISELMEKTPKRVIANYFGWFAALELGSLTVDAFKKAGFEYQKVIEGAVKEADPWKYCVDDLSQLMDSAVSRLYVDKSFTKVDKQHASVIINDIKDAYNELIKESDWLDNSTKTKSEFKLNAIHRNVGYPDWILNNTDLDLYYNLKQRADPKKYFESILYLQYNSVLRDFNSLRKPVELDHSWPMAAHIVNAAYEPTQNSITIPAGQLTPPYFDVRYPAQVNYGAIGAVVGHELTHGFDDEGSQFDANGNLRNWWTDSVHKQFDERAECFIKEYSDNLDTQAKMKLNGNNTVGEDIADNGGLREAFRAYEFFVKKNGKQERLPHISQYTAEQQFFISYANTWCSKYRTEYLKNMIQYNPHSPAKYRVNVPISNFKIFSDVYKCKPNSRMNIKDKCVLW